MHRLRLGRVQKNEAIDVRWLLDVAMSSAEAEFYAMVEGATRSIGLQSMASEMGVRMDITLFTDSSAAKSFASQRGLKRIRHLEVKELWIQEEICRGRLRVEKILGTENPANICTKFFGKQDLVDACWGMNVDISNVDDQSEM